MAIGNMGSALALLEGYLASEFLATTYNRNQGSALIVDMVRNIASRADLSYTNLKISAPAVLGATELTATASPAALIGIVAASSSTTVEDAAVLVYEATVTEGTTRYIAALNLDAANTTATGRMYYSIYPEPLPALKLFWSAVDNGADTDIEGTTLAIGVKAFLIYAQ